MSKNVEMIFPTYLYRGRLKQAPRLNKDLNSEIQALENMDQHGVKWSRKNYTGGYSSYSSMCCLHQTSPNFSELEKLLAPHLKKYIEQLKWQLMNRKVSMTTCWANSMGAGTYHTLHLHPGSVISGVYYVDLPRGSSALKIEDPRMSMLMASPPRKSSAPDSEQNYLHLTAVPGEFFLFESWLRHEVPPHRASKRRVSISFNYEWL
jgi:uncharacterized protein (TIGR02466 family)